MYPLPEAAASAADYRLAEAAHALQQIPLDGLLLPLRLTQAQLHISYSALQALCVSSKRGMLARALIDAPEMVLPACHKLFAALSHQPADAIESARLSDTAASSADLMLRVTEIQQAAEGTRVQLEGLKACLQKHSVGQLTEAYHQVCMLPASSLTIEHYRDITFLSVRPVTSCSAHSNSFFEVFSTILNKFPMQQAPDLLQLTSTCTADSARLNSCLAADHCRLAVKAFY